MENPKKNDTGKTYEIGFNAGLSALENINNSLGNVPPHVLKNALAGLLTAACRCAYAFAPNEEAATEIIELSRKFGLEDVRRQKLQEFMEYYDITDLQSVTDFLEDGEALSHTDITQNVAEEMHDLACKAKEKNEI